MLFKPHSELKKKSFVSVEFIKYCCNVYFGYQVPLKYNPVIFCCLFCSLGWREWKWIVIRKWLPKIHFICLFELSGIHVCGEIPLSFKLKPVLTKVSFSAGWGTTKGKNVFLTHRWENGVHCVGVFRPYDLMDQFVFCHLPLPNLHLSPPPPPILIGLFSAAL